jgi:hypothetical protein
MTPHEEELLSLEELQSVLNTYAGPPIPCKRPARSGLRHLRPLMIGAIAVVALSVAGVAIADDLGAFKGISGAEHPQGVADALSPAVVADINSENAGTNRGARGQLLADSARFVRQLTTGERIYAITTTTDELCVLIVGRPGSNMKSAVGCGDPLSQTDPTTAESVQPNPANPPLTYGVAIDGVTSVSILARGDEATVPVENNVWAYEGPSDDEPLTVHYADGTTQTLTDGQWQSRTH